MNMESGNDQLAQRILGLFDDTPLKSSRVRPLFDTRQPLDVEITCFPVSSGNEQAFLAVEMRVGPQRLYIVKHIRELLRCIDRGECYVFSRHFSYDPSLHCFHPEHFAVIQQLIAIYRNENVYRHMPHSAILAKQGNDERMLLIPPYSWDALLPALQQAPSVLLAHDGSTFEGLSVIDEPLPIQFRLDEADKDAYCIDVQGLEQVTVLESYGAVIANGVFIPTPFEQCKRLSDLKKTLGSGRQQRIPISPNQIGPIMDKVVPGLQKLGNVRVAQAIADRVVQPELQAKLYLDRIRDRLLAGLEFHYGDISINPLDPNRHKHTENRILMRNTEKEQRILEIMEQSPFVKTEGGYFLEDEDAEYNFMYHVVPQLQRILHIYATSAVKERLFIPNAPPKISVNVDERIDWLEFKFEMDGISEAEIRKLLKAIEEKRHYYRMANGALMPLESEQFQEIIRFMNEVGLRQGEASGAEFRIPVMRGLHLIDSQGERQAVRFGRSFRKLLENLRNPDHLEFPVPDSLVHVLREYQAYGFQWLKTLAHYHFGGILADDMGLGKTLQSIAFMVSVLPDIQKRHLPALVVCPASLMYNWRNEFTRFAPSVRTIIADGHKAERIRKLNHLEQVDVIITSYPLLRRDIEWYAKHSFHTVFLDEAQAFKNYTTQTAQSVKALQAEYCFALTGTPVENSLEELWSIYDAVFPGLFPGRKEFSDLPRDVVAKRSRPFLLRRLKTDVLQELPEKIESLQAAELLPEQKKLYIAYLAKLQKDALKHLDEDGFQKSRIKILAGITRLRQLCCHPGLFMEDYTGSSAKFEQLLEIIAEAREAGRRPLIFSQFTEMLALIKRELAEQGVSYFYLDGQTPSAERVELCSRFNAGERDLFLASLKAGGTGLNLTGADTVILYDLWWNPAVEQQAADRAHRIGQKQVVQVIRLVAQGTVEDKMYEIQQRKKNLIEEVIRPGEEAISALTEQDIRDILNL